MAVKFTEKEIEMITEDYQKGMCPKDLGSKYNRNPSSVINMLKRIGVFIPSRKRWTKEEEDFLRKVYPVSNSEQLRKLFPDRDLNILHIKANKIGIKRESFHWSQEEEKMLTDNYHKHTAKELVDLFGGRFSIDAIRAKAVKMGLSNSASVWTKKEDDIIREFYPRQSASSFLDKLPGRTVVAVQNRAHILGVISYYYDKARFSEKDEKFILDNWKTMSDKTIASILQKRAEDVKTKRKCLGLHRCHLDSGYESITRQFRYRLFDWKNSSMAACNYKCVLTGSKDFQIHHLVSFNTIVSEVYEELHDRGMLKYAHIDEYSDNEVEELVDVFTTIHNRYPLGVCVQKDLHALFHRLYGNKNKTPAQWEEFKTRYHNCEFR